MTSGWADDLEFGTTYVVRPGTVHSTTIIWLHDIGRTGLDSVETVQSLRIPNIKWICPTAPIRPVTIMCGRRTTAWFDVYSHISQRMQDDLDSLSYVTTYVAVLLSCEPSHVIKGVGGFGMGAAQALFYASSYAIERVSIHAKIIIGINGWLPDWRNLQANMGQHSRSALCAASTRMIITSSMDSDFDFATYAVLSFVKKCLDSLRSCGFIVSFKPYGRIDAINEIRAWLLAYGLT